MSHVPLPVRVAAGLMITALEQARKLPDQLADLPVTAASRAVQAGMRVQQRVTELAIKGDQVFSLLRPVEDTPPWARFDEDGEVDEATVARTLSPTHACADQREAADRSTTQSVLAGYDETSLAQLRTKLRGYSLAQLMELREYEQAHQDRPAFVTLLSNRISTVRSQQPGTP